MARYLAAGNPFAQHRWPCSPLLATKAPKGRRGSKDFKALRVRKASRDCKVLRGRKASKALPARMAPMVPRMHGVWRVLPVRIRR